MERINVNGLNKISEEPRGHSVKYWIEDDGNKLVKYNDPTCKDSDVMESISAVILDALHIDTVKVELGYNSNQDYLDKMEVEDPNCCIIDSFLVRRGDTIYELHHQWTRPQTGNEQKDISICFYKVFHSFESLLGIDSTNIESMKRSFVRQIFGDCIIDNEDRRLNNIGVIYNERDFAYRLAPSFDNALAFNAFNLGGGEGYCHVGNQLFPAGAITEYIVNHHFDCVEDIVENLNTLATTGIEPIISNYGDEISPDKLSFICDYIGSMNETVKSLTTKQNSKEK